MTPGSAIDIQTLGLLDWLWQTTWQVAMLIALVALVCVIGRRVLAPRWRYALWLLVAVRLAMPVLPGSSLSLFNLLSSDAPAHDAPLPAQQVIITTGVMEASAAPLPPLIVPAAAESQWQWRHWLTVAWLSGAGFFAALMLLANVRLMRALRRDAAEPDDALHQLLAEAKQIAGVRRHVRIVIFSGIPALVGWLRPVIVLPPHLRANLDDEQLRFVLLHELAHLRRHDVLVQWLLLPLQALHWFNPLVWWAGACLRNERELACDEQVLRWTQPQRRAEYGRSLLAVMELTRNMRALPGERLSGGAVAMASSNLFRRIDMISRSDKQGLTRRGRGIIGVTAVAAVVAVGMTGAAEGQQGERRQAPPPDGRTHAPAQNSRFGSHPPMIIYDHPGGRAMLLDPVTGETRPYMEKTPRGAAGHQSMYEEGGYGREGLYDHSMMEAYEGGEMAGQGSQTSRLTLPPSAATGERALTRAQQRHMTTERMTPPEAARRLASVRIPVNFQQTPLRDAIDFIAAAADVNIIVHWQHLQRAGFDPQAHVTIHTRGPISAATTLQLVLEQLSTPTQRLTMEARPEVVVISAEGGMMTVPGGPGFSTFDPAAMMGPGMEGGEAGMYEDPSMDGMPGWPGMRSGMSKEMPGRPGRPGGAAGMMDPATGSGMMSPGTPPTAAPPSDLNIHGLLQPQAAPAPGETGADLYGVADTVLVPRTFVVGVGSEGFGELNLELDGQPAAVAAPPREVEQEDRAIIDAETLIVLVSDNFYREAIAPHIKPGTHHALLPVEKMRMAREQARAVIAAPRLRTAQGQAAAMRITSDGGRPIDLSVSGTVTGKHIITDAEVQLNGDKRAAKAPVGADQALLLELEHRPDGLHTIVLIRPQRVK